MATQSNDELLRLKIADWVDDYAETLLGSEYSGRIDREECLDGLLELVKAGCAQARQQTCDDIVGLLHLNLESIDELEPTENIGAVNFRNGENKQVATTIKSIQDYRSIVATPNTKEKNG